MRLIPVVFGLLLWAPLARAQDAPAPDPTPPPSQDGPPTPAPTATPVVEYPAPEYPASEQPRLPDVPPRSEYRPVAAGGLLPTMGIGTQIQVGQDQGENPQTSVPIWLGVQMKPIDATFAPFSAVGLELDLVHSFRGSTATDVVPELRTGMSLGTKGGDFWSRLFPWLNVYAIGGYRIQNDREYGAWRWGVGISSPATMILVGAANCAPVPTTFEFVQDYEPYTGIRTQSIRWGFQF